MHLEGGAPIATFTLPPQSYVLKWTRDGKALPFLVLKDGISNLFVQPLVGGPARPLARLHEPPPSAITDTGSSVPPRSRA